MCINRAHPTLGRMYNTRCLDDLVVMARMNHPIPSRTRTWNFSAPMVLCLKARESRSLPGLLSSVNYVKSSIKLLPLTIKTTDIKILRWCNRTFFCGCQSEEQNESLCLALLRNTHGTINILVLDQKLFLLNVSWQTFGLPRTLSIFWSLTKNCRGVEQPGSSSGS